MRSIREALLTLLAFTLRNELIIGLAGFGVWVFLLAYEVAYFGGSLTQFVREARWIVLTLGLFMLVREWGPYKESRLLFRAETRDEILILSAVGRRDEAGEGGRDLGLSE